ncbi:MAG: HD domain-containing protein [Verrucomicrobiaceae bacterium]|nr:HD domain-containing protein [Verrucomicrobiaceae bacterium]
MEDTTASDLDLITITQLRQVANQTPQPYRLHLQVESRIEKATSSGSPFFEVKLVDASDSFVWRVFDNHPLFQDTAKLTRNSFIQLAGQWVDGKYGLEPRQVQMRAEHVAQMIRCAVAIAGVYPTLNRDLMIAGVLFHDCGKLWENAYAESGFTMPYNLTAEMLGHIPLGLELVNKMWRDMLDTPAAAEWTLLEPASETVRLHLLHLVAAHHGTHEFGSPVLPKTPEAIALHHVDNIDAKLEMFRRAYETGKELAPGIIEKFMPWPVNIVAPLPAVNLFPVKS